MVQPKRRKSVEKAAAARREAAAKRRKSQNGEFTLLLRNDSEKKCLDVMNQNLGVGSLALTEQDDDSLGKVQFFQLYCCFTVSCKLNIFNNM